MIPSAWYSYDWYGPNASSSSISAVDLDDRMLTDIFLGGHARVVGVLVAVPPFDRRRRSCPRRRDRVSGEEVAPKDTLADDERLVMRPVVVGNVDFVKAAAQPRELEGRAADLETPVEASHPEARVAGRNEKLRLRGGHALRPAGHEHEDEERQKARHAPQI